MRAVLDTNVIVSGLLSQEGNAGLVLAMAFARKFDLVVSTDLFAEYEAGIRRPTFQFRVERQNCGVDDGLPRPEPHCTQTGFPAVARRKHPQLTTDWPVSRRSGRRE